MLNTLITSAPDVFTTVHPSTSYMNWLWLLVAALFVLVAGVFGLPDRRSDRYFVPRLIRGVVAILLAVLMVIIAFTLASAGRDARHAVIDAHKAAYAKSIVSWLADDYGIDADVDSAKELIDGESLAAEYDGGRVVITLTKTTTGTVAIIDEHKTLVPLLSE
jgi:hypothetical protein